MACSLFSQSLTPGPCAHSAREPSSSGMACSEGVQHGVEGGAGVGESGRFSAGVEGLAEPLGAESSEGVGESQRFSGLVTVVRVVGVHPKIVEPPIHSSCILIQSVDSMQEVLNPRLCTVMSLQRTAASTSAQHQNSGVCKCACSLRGSQGGVHVGAILCQCWCDVGVILCQCVVGTLG